jgi:hypothetical protein
MAQPPTTDFLRDVERAYQGEVYGEALYNGIADALDDPERAHKWRVLAELEVVTKDLMRALVAKLGGDTDESASNRKRGLDRVGKYTSLTWAEFMSAYSRELDPVITRYARLEELCASEDAPTLRMLTEHEVVTKIFCDRELAGETENSLTPTLDLIAQIRTLSGAAKTGSIDA